MVLDPGQQICPEYWFGMHCFSPGPGKDITEVKTLLLGAQWGNDRLRASHRKQHSVPPRVERGGTGNDSPDTHKRSASMSSSFSMPISFGVCRYSDETSTLVKMTSKPTTAL